MRSSNETRLQGLRSRLASIDDRLSRKDGNEMVLSQLQQQRCRIASEISSIEGQLQSVPS